VIAWLERHQLLVAGIACLVLLAGVVLPRLADAGDTQPIVFREGFGLEPGTPIRVHVTGAVAEPGVYELAEGDRVAEALTVAGGPTSDADLEAVNLARRLRDEGQVVIPRRAGAQAAVTLAPGAKVDINSANEALLDQLPGIGEAYSRRIVDSRRLDGPYRTTQELVDRRVLPRATYEQIRELITVGP
jgi:competence protein ComEA